MSTTLPGIHADTQKRPRTAKPTVNQAQSSGQRAATSTRPGSNGPSEREGPEEAWIRNTCCFSLGLRKLFILFFPDCFIWQILGEMASSFPRVLEAAYLFLQLAVLQVGVTGTHMETRCHWWAGLQKYREWVGSAEWQEGLVPEWQRISHLHYWWLLFAAPPRSLPKPSSLTEHCKSLSQLRICCWCLLHLQQQSLSIPPSS